MLHHQIGVRVSQEEADMCVQFRFDGRPEDLDDPFNVLDLRFFKAAIHIKLIETA
jgi:hypothetical protein